MSNIWEHGPAKWTERYVLLAIADNANDDGVAWPSIPRLVRKCVLSKSTVLRTIQELEKEGWLTVERHEGKANSYQVNTRHPCHADTGVTETPVSQRHRTGVTLTPDPCQADTRTIKNHKESSNTIIFDVSPDFEELNRIWPQPRGDRSVNSQTVFVHCCQKVDSALILKAARAYLGSVHDPKYCLGLVKWLEQEHWKDQIQPKRKWYDLNGNEITSIENAADSKPN